MIRFDRPIRRAVGLALALGLVLQAMPVPALAQPVPLPPPPSAVQTLDPPGRVARLADASGAVWLYTPDAGEWISALRNQPLTSGDRLATDADGRAELRIGSTTLRLDGGAELEVARLDDEHIALRLHAGSLTVRLRTPDAVREFELATSEGRFIARRPGRYRIDRTPPAGGRGAGASSALTVYEGEAAYEGRGSALTVYPNQRADFRLDAGGAQYAITEAVADGFARWSGERDREDDRAAASAAFAAGYVSPEMTGAEDLDRNGHWEQDAEYGALWIPRVVPPGWAPYAAGRWTWVQPWGWTWVDDAPWGFAPFHYGRWLYRGSSWCWAPGSYVRRPVYAPALVVWLGGGRPERPGEPPPERRDGRRPEPSIGWFPLAPREAYVPAYRVSPRYARDVNGGHVPERPRADDRRDPRPVAGGGDFFRNRQVPNALTVLPESALLQRPPGGVPTAPWRQPRGGRDDERDARNPIAAPPAPLALTSPNRPALQAEPGRPAWPRPGPAGGGRGADDALQRPAPAGAPQPAVAARPPLAEPSRPPVVPSMAGGLPAPPPNVAVPSPSRNGGPPPTRDRRVDEVVAPRIVAPAAPVAPLAPAATAPAPPVLPVMPAAPAWQGRPATSEPVDGRGRDGVSRRDLPRADPSSPVERRDFSRPDRSGEDRRGERPDGNPSRRDEQRRSAAPPAPAAPSPAAVPLPAPPVVARPPAGAVPAPPLQAPAPAAQPLPAPAAAPQARPPREAARPAPPPVATPPAPAPDEVRRAMPVNRAPPDDPRGATGAAQREQRQSR